MNEKVFDATVRPFHFQFFDELQLLSTFPLEVKASKFSRVKIDFPTNANHNSKAPFAHARWYRSYKIIRNLVYGFFSRFYCTPLKTVQNDDSQIKDLCDVSNYGWFTKKTIVCIENVIA